MKSNEQSEKMCQTLYFALLKVTAPCAMIPKLLISFYGYYTTDLQSDAFVLGMPKWYGR